MELYHFLIFLLSSMFLPVVLLKNLATHTGVFNTIDLIDVDNQMYAIQVSIGYPPQKFVLLFDTTSEYTWVRGSNCQYCSYGKTFAEKESETLTLTNATCAWSDLSQNIKGEIAYDFVSIKIFSSNNMPFIIVNDDYFLDGVDGVVGFGYGGRNELMKFSILDKLYQSNQIKERIFSIKLNDEEIPTNITIGKIPDYITHNRQNYSICNINTTLHNWNCEVSHLVIGDQTNFYKAIPLHVNALFSTTVSNLVVPVDYLDFFLSKYFSSTYYPEYDSKFCYVKPDGKKNYILCNVKYFDVNKAPALSFIMNGFAYRIPPQDLFEQIFSDAYHQYCVFKITFTETPDKQWVLGHNFLKQYEVVFNKEDATVGFYSGVKHDFSKFTSDPTETFCLYNYSVYFFVALLVVCSMGYMLYKKKKLELYVEDFQNDCREELSKSKKKEKENIIFKKESSFIKKSKNSNN